jgi:diguanylate cyclase (GGDEF)-like protein/hemerythrin-like metal-binding protein
MTQAAEKQATVNSNQFEVFPWNDNFDTGHALIDKQHRILIDLLNQLAGTLVKNEFSVVNEAFDALTDYANLHFDEEEAIWSEYFGDDSWFSSHQLSHASFLPKVIELKEQDSGKPLCDVVEHVVKFLIRWLAFHIIDHDKRMAIVVEAMESGASIEEAKIRADRKMSGSMRVLIETVLSMYDGLSSRTLELLRERNARTQAEEKLKQANKKLEALSITDQLTGLYNRRYLESVFENESRRALRNDLLLTVYLIDIDFFKSFNDNYGHLAGDNALKCVADRLKEICRRPSDYVFRIGGEEFAILSINQVAQDALMFGEIIRKSIVDLKIPHDHSKVSKYATVSVGGVCKAPVLNENLDAYVEIADKRLYHAKSSGRNAVVMSDGSGR